MDSSNQCYFKSFNKSSSNTIRSLSQSQSTETLIGIPDSDDLNTLMVIDVWDFNLEKEMRIMSQYSKKFNIVAMSTKYPGIVVIPPKSQAQDPYCPLPAMTIIYETLRLNVNLTKLIQLGITLMDKNGNTPPGICSWQFNFQYDLKKDPHKKATIKLLKEAGINFEHHKLIGIDPKIFAPIILRSGLISDKIDWVTFHGGYNFAYLYKVIFRRQIPKSFTEFFENVYCLFRKVYDLKYIVQFCPGLSGESLKQMANMLNVHAPPNIPHQSGFSAYLTARIFIQLVMNFFQNGYEEHSGMLYGFNHGVLHIASLNVGFGQKLNILPKSLWITKVKPDVKPFLNQASKDVKDGEESKLNSATNKS